MAAAHGSFRKLAFSAILFCCFTLIPVQAAAEGKEQLFWQTQNVDGAAETTQTIRVSSSPEGAGNYSLDPSQQNQNSAAAEQQAQTEAADSSVPGVLVVKLKTEAAAQVTASGILNASGALPARDLGAVRSVAALNDHFGARSAEPVFAPAAARLAHAAVNGAPLSKPGALNTAAAPALDYIFEVRIDPKHDLKEAAAQYAKLPEVEYAEPLKLGRSYFIPDDAAYAQQWSHQITQAEPAWDITRGSRSTVIAIVDTGVDHSHEDLSANMLAPCSGGCPAGTGYDFVDTTMECEPGEDCLGRDSDPMDFNGHGTHCAGIAAASGNNAVGISGICPQCAIMPVRAGFSMKGGAGVLEYDDIAAALVYAADNGADVISMSFGGSKSQLLEDAIAYAASKGVVLVGAAGNSNSDSPMYPASYPNVISVASTGQSDAGAFYTNYGFTVDIAAPGGDSRFGTAILSTVPLVGTLSSTSGYKLLQGTSMAAPFAAGLAGLLLSRDSTLNPVEVEDILVRSADRPAETHRYIGAGRVNALRALSTPRQSLRLSITTPQNDDIAGSTLLVTGETTAEAVGISLGSGLYPAQWSSTNTQEAASGQYRVSLPLSEFTEGLYTLRVTAAAGEETRTSFAHFRKIDGIRPGWPVQLGNIGSSLVVEDLDNDGRKEIAALSYGNLSVWGDSYMAVYDSEGRALPGWPKPIGSLFGCIAAGNVDSDEQKELVVTTAANVRTQGGPSAGFRMLAVYKMDGTLLTVAPAADPVSGYGCPVIADLEGDGRSEIIAGSIRRYVYSTEAQTFVPELGNLHAFAADGSEKPGFPVVLNQMNFADPSAADVDSDGKLEIMVGAGNKRQMYVVRHDGTVMAGWPQTLDPQYSSASGVTVADLGGDRTPELITSSYYRLHAFTPAGIPVDPWPFVESKQDISGGVRFTADGELLYHFVYKGSKQIAPVVADLDNDGSPEIIEGSSFVNPAFIYNSGLRTKTLGLPLEGYFWAILMSSVPHGSQPVVGDIDGDGQPEIVHTPSHREAIYAWKPDGTPVTGFPKDYGNHNRPGSVAAPVLSDVDGDGTVEIIFLSGRGGLFVLNTGSQAAPEQLLWPAKGCNSEHTGRCGPPEDRCPEDPEKNIPGACGCGVPDTYTDADPFADCNDACPEDDVKGAPGVCGCGSPDIDSDNDGVLDCLDGCPDDRAKTAPGACGCGAAETDYDADGTPNCVDECPYDRAKTQRGICGCYVSDKDSDSDDTADCLDRCPYDARKTAPGVCGCGAVDVDSDGDGTMNCWDLCSNDPAKTAPGVCGCGSPDTDRDSDGIADCRDLCPEDPRKTSPGSCGCGIVDRDSDGDGIKDCWDQCPADLRKTAPGICGCGTSDADTDKDGTADCRDECPSDTYKRAPGVCGCGVMDRDYDADGTMDCQDQCPADARKTLPGICGCGTVDADSDGDGTMDCRDQCSNDPRKMAPGVCGCGLPDTDSDRDGTPDCRDNCPEDANKREAGVCGCGIRDIDTDRDGTMDCSDGCPRDNQKVLPGICGCGAADSDADGDGTFDCHDRCSGDPAKSDPGVCGCGSADWDTDGDGTLDCLDECAGDPLKQHPGTCGCGIGDADFDGDGTADCRDGCIDDPGKNAPGFCGCGAPETDTDSDLTPDCRDTDDDNDGAADEQELLDGTDPLDSGSVLPVLSTTVCGEWNGFLNDTRSPVWNIQEHVNMGSSALNVESALYDISGRAVSRAAFGVGPGAQTDLLVHGMPGWARNSYGRVCSHIAGNGHPGDIDGRMVHYKTDPAKGENRFQFAFAMPFLNGMKGVQFLPFNTFHPSLNPAQRGNVVANWIQLTNLEETPERGALIFRDQAGNELSRQPVQIGAGARQDFSGHFAGPDRVGLVQWVPQNLAAQFQLRNVRYVFDNPVWDSSFDAAFQLEGMSGSGELLAAPLDADGASSIVEVSNTAARAQAIGVQIYDSAGLLLERRSFELPPFASEHIITDRFLAGSQGLVTVKGSVRSGVIAVVMQYGRLPDGGIKYMYGTQAKQSLGAVLRGTYNTYLGQSCRLQLTNPTSYPAGVRIDMRRFDGTLRLSGHRVHLPAHGMVDFGLCANDNADVYGVVTVQPDTPNSVSATVVRMGNRDDYRFPTPVRQ